MPQEIDGFSHFDFPSSGPGPSNGIRKTVYESHDGSIPLLVLHEMPGMSPSFLQYCRDMAAKDFRVYAPLLFKTPNTHMNLMQLSLFCLNREFRQLFAMKSVAKEGTPFAGWLLELVAEISSRHPDRKMGVVGMCLTGSFAVAAIAVPNVDAAIACQPAFPFFRDIKTLGLSDAQRRQMADRAQTLPVPCAKGYRYQKDLICRPVHMDAVESTLGTSFERYPDLPGRSHSTLTSDSRSEAVFQDVLSFLKHRLP